MDAEVSQDLKKNYYALLATIINEELTADKAIRILSSAEYIDNKKDKKNGLRKRAEKRHLTDAECEMAIKFKETNSWKDTGKLFGISGGSTMRQLRNYLEKKKPLAEGIEKNLYLIISQRGKKKKQ